MHTDDDDHTASLMTPAKLAQLKVAPKPAASPAAWLDQLAADAGSGHVRRLVDLRKQLEGQLGDGAYADVRKALDAVAGEAGKLEFGLLQPKGWLARATGKGKEAAAGFLAQYERVAKAGEDLQDDVRSLQRSQQAQWAAVERTLLEFEVELKAIEKIIDQGARWLQDMRNQLKTREALGGDATTLKAVHEDATRCELLVTRLKQLRTASSAAQQVIERARSQGGRRAGLQERLQQALDGEWAAWQRALAPVVKEARTSGVAGQGVDAARDAGQELQTCAEQAGQDCEQLRAQEQALAGDVIALREPLRAAG